MDFQVLAYKVEHLSHGFDSATTASDWDSERSLGGLEVGECFVVVGIPKTTIRGPVFPNGAPDVPSFRGKESRGLTLPAETLFGPTCKSKDFSNPRLPQIFM